MKKCVFALLVVFVAAGAALADYGPTQNFELVNNTGKTMVSLYIGPSGGRTWRSENELDGYAIASGASVAVEFEPWDQARYWDLYVTFEDGTAWEYDHFDLFSISRITLNKGGMATSE